MNALLLCLTVSSVTSEAIAQPVVEEPRPRWVPAQGVLDPSMWLARRAPLAWQAPLLLALDTVAPVALLVPAGLAGGGLALVGYWALRDAGPSVPSWGRLAVPSLLAMGGAWLAGSLTLLLLDLALSYAHLPRLLSSRLLLVLGTWTPVALSWLLVAVVLPSSQGLGSVMSRGLDGLSVLLAYASVACLTPAVMGGAMLRRMWVDQEEGSVLWEKVE